MRKIAIILIITILYAVIALLSEHLAIQGTVVSPVWPPAGIALAAVIIFGDIALVGVFIGCFIADFHTFTGGGALLPTFLNALAPATGAALQAYLGKLALSVLIGSYNIFSNIKAVLVFIFISAFSVCVINATFGTTSLMLTGNISITELPYDWLTWWIADAVGVVSVTSTILAWKQKWREKMSFSQILNIGVTWLLILLLGYITLHMQTKMAYLFIPIAIWAAFQFEIHFSLLTGVLISSVCLYGATQDYEIIIPATSANTAIILVQIFISIIYLTILLVHTILSERAMAYKDLQSLNMQLEKRVLDRTKDLSESNQQLEIEKNKAIDALEALKHSHARLMQSEKMASLGFLTAGVAHEIKHPLNAMSSNMESIKKNMHHIIQFVAQIEKDGNIKDEVNHISKNTDTLIMATNEGIKRTSGVIADLCAFASSDEPEMIMTDLNRNIDSTLNLLSSESKNIRIIKEYGTIPAVLCHPGKINQVIMNILINAIHALQTRQGAEITIKTQSNADSIILSIKDNGSGMKKETIDKLFTPFFTTKKGGLGSGLGLFISYNIIKEHNGNITVTSEPGKGTEFTITLPIKKDSSIHDYHA